MPNWREEDKNRLSQIRETRTSGIFVYLSDYICLTDIRYRSTDICVASNSWWTSSVVLRIITSRSNYLSYKREMFIVARLLASFTNPPFLYWLRTGNDLNELLTPHKSQVWYEYWTKHSETDFWTWTFGTCVKLQTGYREVTTLAPSQRCLLYTSRCV